MSAYQTVLPLIRVGSAVADETAADEPAGEEAAAEEPAAELAGAELAAAEVAGAEEAGGAAPELAADDEEDEVEEQAVGISSANAASVAMPTRRLIMCSPIVGGDKRPSGGAGERSTLGIADRTAV